MFFPRKNNKICCTIIRQDRVLENTRKLLISILDHQSFWVFAIYEVSKLLDNCKNVKNQLQMHFRGFSSVKSMFRVYLKILRPAWNYSNSFFLKFSGTWTLEYPKIGYPYWVYSCFMYLMPTLAHSNDYCRSMTQDSQFYSDESNS